MAPGALAAYLRGKKKPAWPIAAFRFFLAGGKGEGERGGGLRLSSWARLPVLRPKEKKGEPSSAFLSSSLAIKGEKRNPSSNVPHRPDHRNVVRRAAGGKKGGRKRGGGEGRGSGGRRIRASSASRKEERKKEGESRSPALVCHSCLSPTLGRGGMRIRCWPPFFSFSHPSHKRGGDEDFRFLPISSTHLSHSARGKEGEGEDLLLVVPKLQHLF